MDHLLLLGGGDFREDRQTQHLSGQLLRNREAARRVTQIRVGGLAVDGNGVINDRVNAALAQIALQPVAATTFRQAMLSAGRTRGAAASAGSRCGIARWHPNHELIPAVACWASLRKLNASAGCQGVLITGRHGAATLEPTRQTGQFHGQHRGLQGVEAAVVAEVGVQIAAGHAVDGQLTDALGQLSVLAGHSTAITSRTQVFGGEEAEAPGITPAADGAASPAGACGLGAILNHQQLMAPGDGGERLHVHRTAK